MPMEFYTTSGPSQGISSYGGGNVNLTNDMAWKDIATVTFTPTKTGTLYLHGTALVAPANSDDVYFYSQFVLGTGGGTLLYGGQGCSFVTTSNQYACPVAIGIVSVTAGVSTTIKLQAKSGDAYTGTAYGAYCGFWGILV